MAQITRINKITLGVLLAIIIIIAGYWLLNVRNAPQRRQISEETIKIGVIAPLTGDGALYGEAHQKSTKLAQEEINNAGGVLGQKIELIYEDGKCSGKDAVSALQKLITIDKVKIVIGGLCSSETLAAVPIATLNKILLFSPGSSSPDLTGASEYFVRNFPSDATQGTILANYAAGDMRIKKMAIIQEQQDYTFGIFRAFEKQFLSLGGEIFHEKYSTGETDFLTLLTKLKVNNPEALFIISNTSANAEKILQDLNALAWKPALFMNDNAAAETEVVERNAALMEGAVTAEVGVDLDNRKYQEFKSAYKKRYGTELIFANLDPIFYDALFMIRDGLLAVGYRPEQLAKWIKDVKDWQGASGEIDIKDDGDRASGHVLKVIRKGKIIPLQ